MPSSSTRYAASRAADSTGPAKRRCCFCHPCCFILVAAVLVTVGGVLIWKLLPDTTKSSLQNASQDLTSGLTNGGGSARDNSTTSSESSLGTPPTFDYYRCSSYNNCCNGVDTICDLRVSDVMFAGLHNAYSSVQDGFLLAGNHEYDLEQGLQAGFRAINVDLGNCNGNLELVHSKCELGTRDPYTVFTNIQLFLDKHPRDLLLIPIQVNNNVDQVVNLWDFYSILESIPGFTDRMYAHNETQFWPTMRDLMDADQRIILFVYNADVICRTPGNCPPGFHDWFLFASETQYEFESVADIEDTALSCPYDRGDQGYKDFYALNVFVSNPLPSKASAKLLNDATFLEAHVEACEQVVGRNASVVFVDFWEEGNLVDLVQSHNQQLGTGRRL